MAALDAYGRGALSDGSQAVLSSSAAGLAQAGLQALGPLRPFLLPFPTPLEVLSRHARPPEAEEDSSLSCQGLGRSQPWLPAEPPAAGQGPLACAIAAAAAFVLLTIHCIRESPSRVLDHVGLERRSGLYPALNMLHPMQAGPSSDQAGGG